MYQKQHVDSFSAWKPLVSSAFVPLTSEPLRNSSFVGSIAGNQFGSVGVMEVEATAHTVRRTEELLAAGEQPQFKLNLQLSGHGILLQDGRETLLRPGELAIYDTERPYTLMFEEEFKTLVLMFPQQQLGLSMAQVHEMTATAIGTEQPLCRAITPFLAQLAGLLPQLHGPVGQRLAANTVDLLGTLLAAELYAHDEFAPDARHRQMRAIQEFIDEHLADPSLSPGTIADSHYISLRSLHNIFSESGHTVSEWIRTRRLEQCRRDLADPFQHQVSVGAVGARWGLPDAAHFSRVFRAAYGISPSAFRAQN